MTFDRHDAACEVACEHRKKAIKECIKEDKGFAWRWRIVESATAKLSTLRSTDPIKAKSLARRIRHLETYCEDSIKETLDANEEAAAEAKDPYGYRGLRRSDF